MTKIIKKFEDKQYIKRLDNKLAKRSKLVQLSLKGELLVPKVLKKIFTYEESCFKNFDIKDKIFFRKLLMKSL